MLLGNLGITLIPEPDRHPLGPDGHLVDPKQEAKVKALGAALAQQLKKQLG